MAFLKNQKALFSGLLAAAGGATAFAYFYPYNRDLVMTNMQINEADAFTVKKIEEAYQKLQKATDCNSLLKKHLTTEVLDLLKFKKTKLGASLYDVIRSGIFNLDSKIGVYAADTESYKTFAKLFDPIIQEYHGASKDSKQPDVDMGEDKLSELPPLDPEKKYIKSTRIRCDRTLAGYPFGSFLTQDDYLIMQQKVMNALKNIKDDELKGLYYPLEGMTKSIQNRLIDEHVLFRECDRHLKHANACKYWPKGRGIYFNYAKNFMVWVNEKDHLKIISVQEGSNVGQILERLAKGVKLIEEQLSFARDERLGWLNLSPADLGSSIRASVHIHLPKLSKHPQFKETCEKLNLEVRSTDGKDISPKDGLFEISNKVQFGITEFEAVKQMYDGVKELIRLDQQL